LDIPDGIGYAVVVEMPTILSAPIIGVPVTGTNLSVAIVFALLVPTKLNVDVKSQHGPLIGPVGNAGGSTVGKSVGGVGKAGVDGWGPLAHSQNVGHKRFENIDTNLSIAVKCATGSDIVSAATQSPAVITGIGGGSIVQNVDRSYEIRPRYPASANATGVGTLFNNAAN
jgi:hypothetical protein